MPTVRDKKTQLLRAIYETRDAALLAKRKYLEAAGWVSSDSKFHLWEKELDDGRTAIVTVDEAIGMQAESDDMEYLLED